MRAYYIVNRDPPGQLVEQIVEQQKEGKNVHQEAVLRWSRWEEIGADLLWQQGKRKEGEIILKEDASSLRRVLRCVQK